MKLIKGNMFNNKDGVRLVTTNSYIKNDEALVMGRGAAKYLKDSVLNIDHIFGKEVERICGHLGKYGVFVLPYDIDGKSYGAFQVKYHFKSIADLDLIKYSTKQLMTWDFYLNWNIYNDTKIKFHLNFPGIGNGGLDPEEVMPIIKDLPDNVLVYYL